MRKLSTIAAARNQAYALDVELHDKRPRRVEGSTITSWPGAIDVDLTVLLAAPQPGATITATTAGMPPQRPASCSGSNTVSLSDGTRITFASAGQVTIAETL